MPVGLKVVNDGLGDGVVGSATGTQSSYGVHGISNTTGDPRPLFPYSFPAGVYGEWADYRNQPGAGVVGASDAAGTGVFGYGPQGVGVYGLAPEAFPPSYSAGVFGTGDLGVLAVGGVKGVHGRAQGPGGPDVYVVGVSGESDSRAYTVAGTHLIGVAGGSDTGTGVAGAADSGVGVIGDGGRRGVGIVAIGNDSNYALVTKGGFSGPGGTASGDVFIQGSLLVAPGFPKQAVIKTRDGSHRSLYCVESPECWFEDFGRARLVRGRTRVRLDRAFAEVIKTADYHVFLSPEGPSHGVYVSRRSRNGFEVREQHPGASTVPFSYRIVARRKDVDAPRFKRVKLPELPKLPSRPPTVKPPKIPVLRLTKGRKPSRARTRTR